MSDIIFDWQIFLQLVKTEVSELSFVSWIEPLRFENVSSGVLNIDASSSFIKNWVELNYIKLMLVAAKQCSEEINSINLFVATTYSQPENSNQSEIYKGSKLSTNNFQSEYDKSHTFDIPLNPKYTFENFVVGKPNMFAYNATKSIAEGEVHYNPLFIHGGVGLGKTHLMHSIAWAIKNNFPQKQFLYLTAEKFMNMFVLALRDKSILSFKEIFRNTDILMIDDFQFMSGKDQTQEEFFHTLNSLISHGKQIVLSADKSPHLLSNIEERIRSRLQAGLTIDIHETNYELRLGILESKANLLDIKFPRDVLEFLAHTVTSNVRELEGCFNKLISYHQIMKVDITIDLAMEQLKDVIKYNNKPIEVEIIQKKISEHYKIKFSDLISTKKDKQTVFARHVAVYISKQLTKLSLAEIGSKFGGRDHTTIIYSINKMEKSIEKDANLNNEISFLIKTLKQQS